MKVINEFIYGGNSRTAKIGYIFGCWMILLIKSSFIVLVLLLTILISQAIQYSTSINDIHNDHLTQWAGSDSIRLELVASYRYNCFGEHELAKISVPITKPISIYDCALEHGSNELSAIIKNATGVITPASPLNWLVDTY